MKSSNLALRLDDDAPQPGRTSTTDSLPAGQEPPRPAKPRPRRPLEFRSIVVRDQGFAPFRVR